MEQIEGIWLPNGGNIKLHYTDKKGKNYRKSYADRKLH